jgi:hypothetical protein
MIDLTTETKNATGFDELLCDSEVLFSTALNSDVQSNLPFRINISATIEQQQHSCLGAHYEQLLLAVSSLKEHLSW